MTDTTTIISEVSNMTELEFVEFVEQLREVADANNWTRIVQEQFELKDKEKKMSPTDIQSYIETLDELKSDLRSAEYRVDDRITALKKLIKK